MTHDREEGKGNSEGDNVNFVEQSGVAELRNDGWDFWQEVGIVCGGYDSVTDFHLIKVFIETSKEKFWYQDIASRLGLDEHYVCLLIEILASADFCEYGSSPRGAWATHGAYEANLSKLIEWYERKWEEKFPLPEPPKAD
jgi:hypothetical protein